MGNIILTGVTVFVVAMIAIGMKRGLVKTAFSFGSIFIALILVNILTPVAKEVIKNNNLSEKVVIATNEFHEYRAKLYCDREGLDFHSHCSHTSFYSLLTFSTREMLGVVKYKVFG